MDFSPSQHKPQHRRVSSSFTTESFSFFRADGNAANSAATNASNEALSFAGSAGSTSTMQNAAVTANSSANSSMTPLSSGDPSLDIQTVLGALDLDFAPYKQISSGNSGFAGSRQPFALHDSDSGAESRGAHHHSWSVSGFSTANAASASSAASSFKPMKSRFAHSASRSVSNPLFSAPQSFSSASSSSSSSTQPSHQKTYSMSYDASSAVSSSTAAAAPIVSSSAAAPAYPESAASAYNESAYTDSAAASNSAPLWQKSIKTRFIDRNSEHKRSWSIASYSVNNAANHNAASPIDTASPPDLDQELDAYRSQPQQNNYAYQSYQQPNQNFRPYRVSNNVVSGYSQLMNSPQLYQGAVGSYGQMGFGAQPINNYQNNRRSKMPQNGLNKLNDSHQNMTAIRKKGDDGSRFVNAAIDDFKDQIYSLCKDQHGCRFLQRQLDIYDINKTNKENVKEAQSKFKRESYAATLIYNEIHEHIVELMTDQFGNYLIQKLFDQVTVKQRVQLMKNSAPDFIKISLDSHGTRALQTLIEVVSTQEETAIIINAFQNDVVTLSRDLNGNHVIQKILTKFNSKPENIQFVFDAACSNCIKISTHRHGCCVLQRCLDFGSVEQCKQLSMVIAQNCLNLAVDPFGNYVVQYVLSKGEEESIKVIVYQVVSKMLLLSTHKFGSNVIEKILRINTLSHVVIDEILKNLNPPSGSPETQNLFLSKLLHDAFGNYVLQTVLDVAEKPTQFNQLAEAIRPLLPGVRNTAQGRRIATRVQALS